MNEVADYVEQVRAELADLPPSVRDELLEDLPEHLAEVAAEGEGSLAERLGPPSAYAAELRTAAGAPTGRGRRATVDLRVRDAVVKARARLQVIDTKSGPVIGYEHASDFLRLLRPAWWVLRGYLVAMALAYLLTDEPIGLLPRVDLGDRTVAAVVVLLGFVVGSIWLGRLGGRLSRVPRLALGIGTALLILAAIASLADADDDSQRDPYQVVAQSSNNVESVYVFDDQGRPLTNARVFDQDGNPVQPGFWWCPNETGGMTADIFPRCAIPQPVSWDPPVREPFELDLTPSGTPTSPTSPTSEPTAMPESAPAVTPTPTPTATRTPPPTPTSTPTSAPSAPR